MFDNADLMKAITTIQTITPPFMPSDPHVMTSIIEWPAGSPGAPPHRHPGGPSFGYVLDGEMLFELEGEEPRVIKAGEAFWSRVATSSTTPTPTTAPTCRCGSSSR